jgi:hypothetical protein
LALLAAVTAGSLAAAEIPESAVLGQYRKLQCDPRSLVVRSSTPLEFATVATCYKLPGTFAHDGWIQLVAVDVEANRLRLVDLGTTHDAALSLHDDGHGGWRWVARPKPRFDANRTLEVWSLSKAETQPHLSGRVELPFDFDRTTLVSRGEQCLLIGAGKPNQALLRISDAGAGLLPMTGIRGVRLWHPQLNAFVVQTDPESLATHELLDCEGNRRPLPTEDAARFAEFPRQQIAISSRGDWLVRFESPEGDEFAVLRKDFRRSYGPFQWLPKDCPDVSCAMDGLLLLDPGWSPSGETFSANTLAETLVVDAAELKTVVRWKHRAGGETVHTALLSDSLAMSLSKKHGISFRGW